MKKFKVDYRTRQQYLTYFVSGAVILLFFFWTYTLVDKARFNTEVEIVSINDRIQKVEELSAIVVANSSRAKLNTSLFAYAQNLQKVNNIKLVNSSQAQEQVTFKSEGLVYEELAYLINTFEQYTNVWIKNLTISRRFDDSRKIDVVWDIVRFL